MILPQLRHVLLARHRRGHGIHSPFLYHLVTQVLFNKNRYYSFDRIESLIPATPNEHVIGQTLFRLAEDTKVSNMVVFCNPDTVDVAYLKSVKADAQLIRLTNAEELKQLPSIDLAVFDVCHESESLDKLLDNALLMTHPSSVFVLKNIHAKGKEHYWLALINHPQVTASLDVFHLGIAFFRPDLEKKCYRIRQ